MHVSGVLAVVIAGLWAGGREVKGLSTDGRRLLTPAGTPFPMRDLVAFLAAATIILTLALNGITLPWLSRKLQAPSDAIGLPEESTARVTIARAGIAAEHDQRRDPAHHRGGTRRTRDAFLGEPAARLSLAGGGVSRPRA